MTYWIYRAISALPLSISYRLARLLAWLAQRLFKYRVATVDQNLRRSFPDQSEAWCATTRHRFYQQFADITVETIYAWRMPRDELEQRMTITGWEPLISADGESPKPGIVLSIHHNNWEWLTQRASGTVTAPLDGIYKPLHDRGADRFALESRGKWGATLVKMKDVSRHVLKNRRTPRVLALLADQSPGEREAIHWTRFLNQATAFFMGPATLARLTKYPVYFARTQRLSQGRYHAELLTICTEPGTMSESELIEKYVALAEETIRRQPESYLWTNRRWKLAPPQATLETTSDGSEETQPNP